jgi:hypothetical protein
MYHFALGFDEGRSARIMNRCCGTTFNSPLRCKVITSTQKLPCCLWQLQISLPAQETFHPLMVQLAAWGTTKKKRQSSCMMTVQLVYDSLDDNPLRMVGDDLSDDRSFRYPFFLKRLDKCFRITCRYRQEKSSRCHRIT